MGFYKKDWELPKRLQKSKISTISRNPTLSKQCHTQIKASLYLFLEITFLRYLKNKVLNGNSVIVKRFYIFWPYLLFSHHNPFTTLLRWNIDWRIPQPHSQCPQKIHHNTQTHVCSWKKYPSRTNDHFMCYHWAFFSCVRV